MADDSLITGELLEHELRFEAFPGRVLYVVLFKDVRNASLVREKLLAKELDCAIFNAAVVPDVFPVHVAAFKALTAQARNSLSSFSLHAEVVFNIAGSKHIGESLKRFGVADDSTALLFAKFDATQSELAALRELVQGVPVHPKQLAAVSDQGLIQKYYKFTIEELRSGSQADAIVGRIAAREC